VRSWLSAAIALGAGAFALLAAMRNLETVERVDWVFGSAHAVPLWCVLAASLLVGSALTALGFSLPALRMRLRLRRAERRVAELEREVHGLRTLPLDDELRDVTRET
jgi:hypothetical protein